MTDYAELRAALEIGPTPGPWFVHGSRGYAVATVGKIRIATDELHINIRPEDDAEYIAACHPEAIRALLAERDALRDAVEALLANPSGMYCDGYPEAERKARAALAQGEP